MKKHIFGGLLSTALVLSACTSNEDNEVGSTDAGTTESSDNSSSERSSTSSSSSVACTEDNMQAKAMELAGKMQEMAGDPAKMQDLAGKLQEIQKNVQESGADGSYTIQEACDAYDELLEAVG